ADFFGFLRSFSASSRASLSLVLSSAWSFSLALCLGTSCHMRFRHSSRSSAVSAFLRSASASTYCGVRLTALFEAVHARLSARNPYFTRKQSAAQPSALAKDLPPWLNQDRRQWSYTTAFRRPRSPCAPSGAASRKLASSWAPAW